MGFNNELHYLLWHMWQGVKAGDLPYVLIGVPHLPRVLFQHLQAELTEVVARHLEVAGMLLTGDVMTLLDQNRHHEIIELLGVIVFLGVLLFRILLFLLTLVFRILERRQ